jgi:transposase
MINAARTTTFLGERYGRIARRHGKAKAQVAVARSKARTDTDRKLRNHLRQIQALGFTVTLTKAG